MTPKRFQQLADSRPISGHVTGSGCRTVAVNRDYNVCGRARLDRSSRATDVCSVRHWAELYERFSDLGTALFTAVDCCRVCFIERTGGRLAAAVARYRHYCHSHRVTFWELAWLRDVVYLGFSAVYLMTSFAITLHGQCCRRHLVGQRVVSDISVVRSCWSICSLCTESNSATLLQHACSLLFLERLFLISKSLLNVTALDAQALLLLMPWLHVK